MSKVGGVCSPVWPEGYAELRRLALARRSSRLTAAYRAHIIANRIHHTISSWNKSSKRGNRQFDPTCSHEPQRAGAHKRNIEASRLLGGVTNDLITKKLHDGGPSTMDEHGPIMHQRMSLGRQQQSDLPDLLAGGNWACTRTF